MWEIKITWLLLLLISCWSFCLLLSSWLNKNEQKRKKKKNEKGTKSLLTPDCWNTRSIRSNQFDILILIWWWDTKLEEETIKTTTFTNFFFSKVPSCFSPYAAECLRLKKKISIFRYNYVVVRVFLSKLKKFFMCFCWNFLSHTHTHTLSALHIYGSMGYLLILVHVIDKIVCVLVGIFALLFGILLHVLECGRLRLLCGRRHSGAAGKLRLLLLITASTRHHARIDWRVVGVELAIVRRVVVTIIVAESFEARAAHCRLRVANCAQLVRLERFELVEVAQEEQRWCVSQRAKANTLSFPKPAPVLIIHDTNKKREREREREKTTYRCLRR